MNLDNHIAKRFLQDDALPIYIYCIDGTLIKYFPDYKTFMDSTFIEKWGGKKGFRFSTQKKQRCLAGKMFITRDKKFEVKYNNSSNHNPLCFNQNVVSPHAFYKGLEPVAEWFSRDLNELFLDIYSELKEIQAQPVYSRHHGGYQEFQNGEAVQRCNVLSQQRQQRRPLTEIAICVCGKEIEAPKEECSSCTKRRERQRARYQQRKAEAPPKQKPEPVETTVAELKNDLINSFKRLAKEYNTTEDKVQIGFRFHNDAGEMYFQLRVDYRPKRELHFNRDFLGLTGNQAELPNEKGNIVKAFLIGMPGLTGALVATARKHNIVKWSHLSVFFYKATKTSDIRLAINVQNNLVETIQVFSYETEAILLRKLKIIKYDQSSGFARRGALL